MILVLTHVGLAVVLVLAGFDSRYGTRHDRNYLRYRPPATFTRDRFMSLLAKTEAWRDRVAFVLEIGNSTLVVAFGAWTLISAISR